MSIPSCVFDAREKLVNDLEQTCHDMCMMFRSASISNANYKKLVEYQDAIQIKIKRVLRFNELAQEFVNNENL